MIVTENIELNLIKPINNSKIEKALSAKGLDILRWAIIEIQQDNVILRVSYINN